MPRGGKEGGVMHRLVGWAEVLTLPILAALLLLALI